MVSEHEKGYSTAIWDFAILGLMVLVFLLAISEVTRGVAIGIGVLVPSGVGLLLLAIGMADRFMKGGTGGPGSSVMYDVATAGLVGVVVLMAISPSTRGVAIALGVGIPWGAGILVFAVVLVMGFVQILSAQRTESNFSSLGPEEERQFVPQERNMRANEKSANMLGFGLGGGLFVLGMIVTVGMYSPCYRYCKHAPTACKTEQQVSTWKASCDTTCGRLEDEANLQLLKPTGEDRKGTAMESVSGKEYVEALDACNFANGAGVTCEKIVEKATAMGLWCPDSK